MSVRTFSVLALMGACAACSPSGGADELNASSQGGGSGGAATSGGNGAGASMNVGGLGFGGDYIVGGGNASNGGNAGECAGSTQAAEDIIVEVEVEVTTYEPIAIFIMQDRSGSMVTGFPAPASPESWNNSKTAITAFVSDPTSAGIDIGLGTFPYGPTNTASCADGSDCGTPVVPIAPLPDNADEMIAAMDAQVPSNPIALTPTECALRGMINQCVQFMASSTTGEQCVAVLVTDGNPTQCDTNQANLINLVASGLTQGVKTFALALPGANIAALNEYAQAGGTDCDPNGPNFACDATSGATAFTSALNAIRDSVVTKVTEQQVQQTTLECSWAIPAPDEGDTIDADKVNVDFSADNIPAQPIGKVPSEAECANYQGGWYYDDASNPTTISVCDETCDIIKSASHGRIDIKLGCVTEYSPPR